MSSEGKKARRRRRSASGAGGMSVGGSLPIWIVAFVVIALRILAASSFQEQSLLESPVLEDTTYLTAIQQAHSLDDPEPVLPRGSVLYPALVGLLPGLADGDLGSLAVLQAVLEGLAVLVLGLWVASRWGVLAAVLGGLLYALDPLGAFFAARLAPASFAVLLFALGLVLLGGAPESWKRGPLGAVVFGIVVATGFLLSPLLFFLLAAVGAHRRWTQDGVEDLDPEQTGSRGNGSRGDASPARGTSGGSRSAPGLTPRLVGTLLAVAPLLLAAATVSLQHNGIRDGGPALSWGSALSVYQATRAETGGTDRTLEAPQWRTDGGHRSEAWEALAKEGSSYDLYRFYLARGLQSLVERPVEFLGVELVKLAATLGAAPLPDTGPSPAFILDRSGTLKFGRFTFPVLLALGIAGWLAAPVGSTRRRILLGLLTVLAACLLGTTSAAARQPGVLLLAFAGGAFLASLIGKLEGGRARSPLPLLAVPVVAALSVFLGRLSPTAALLDPSEELRLAGTMAIARSPREAVPLLEQAVRANPTNVEARVSLARAYQRDGLVDGATREYRNAFAVDSTNAGVLLGLAAIEQEQENSERAIELISRLVGEHPNNPLFLNEAARMLLQAGRWDVAKPLLLRALEIKPDYRTAQTNLEAVTRIEMNAERSLVPDEMRLPADDPLNATLAQIGVALQQGGFQVADSLIAIAETERGDHVLPHWMRAAWFARTGDLNGAVRSLETCVRLAPCRPAIAAQLAQLYVQTGREADARRMLDDCIENPPSPDLGPRMAQIREQLFGP